MFFIRPIKLTSFSYYFLPGSINGPIKPHPWPWISPTERVDGWIVEWEQYESEYADRISSNAPTTTAATAVDEPVARNVSISGGNGAHGSSR